jgi:hypothetical protein
VISSIFSYKKKKNLSDFGRTKDYDDTRDLELKDRDVKVKSTF